METDQARIESFLDNGWSVIGQLHQWLSTWPVALDDRKSLDHLILNLQGLWSFADDLGLKRLARTSLALEQLFERFCAKTLEFNEERLRDITKGVEGFQELLLGYEATREEPEIGDVTNLQKLERHSNQPFCLTIVRDVVTVASNAEEINHTVKPPTETIVVVQATSAAPASESAMSITSDGRVEQPLLGMLEQFVVKLDDTCHRLHVRMQTDETPYVTTTSRLEHLAQATRELMFQIIEKNQTTATPVREASLQTLELHSPIEELPPLSLMHESVSEFLEEAVMGSERPIAEPESIELHKDVPNKVVSEVPPEISIAEISKGSNAADVAVSQTHKPRRILIVEESLFYRHLISMAVESAGYEPRTAESIGSGVDILGQSSDFCAILIGSTISTAMAESLERLRREKGMKVIGLTSSNHEGQTIEGIDDQVTKSNPQKLLTVLDRLLNDTPNDKRKSA